MYKVLHVLYQSYPNISGSSTRSKSIVDAMHQSIYFHPIVITSPLQIGLSDNSKEYVDGVLYYRTFKNGNDDFEINKPKKFSTKLRKAFSIFRFTFDVYKVAKKENIDVIHAHAMFFCGLPAWFVAKILRKKFVYEIRSDWHLDNSFSSGMFFQILFGKFEMLISKKCDSLVVISNGLHDKYSMHNNNCYIVSNGVHEDRFNSGDISLNTSKDVEFGFIGSVIPLEGLEMVVRAIAKVKADYNVKIVFKIAGMGESLIAVKNKARELGVEDQIIFYGTLPFERVAEFYSQIDVIVNFRRNEEIAHSVTPLKPLEAMAQKKLVVVSDVRGMLELVTNGVNGVVAPAEDITKLAKLLFDISSCPGEYTEIVNRAYDYVVHNYAWQKKVETYLKVYS
ncbi:TPA: glycosyltransferase [Vibrio vulnificus]|nr:glycosyltransferase [Vibrio vulnificus]HDY7957618.1 glycosyltransferase [Vibrio vulnificus]